MFVFMMHTAGRCQGDATAPFDIDVMFARSAPWIRRKLARIISKDIELAANQGGQNRVVSVSDTISFVFDMLGPPYIFLSCVNPPCTGDLLT